MADNVIKAVFASGRKVKTAPLWRYDHGIRLQPIGLELPENYEMHFSNSKTGEATTVLADSTGAVIPAEYLIPGTAVYAWIYLVGDSYGRTKAEIIIPVDPKAQPTDQEPTPEQQSALEQAIEALNSAATDIQGQIDSALQEAKDSGEFDGTDGSSIWTTTEEPMPASGGEAFTNLVGRSNVPPSVGDIIVRSSRYVYQVVQVLSNGAAIGYQIGDIKGEQGVADAIWRSEVISLMPPSDYEMEVSDLVGRSGAEPKAGDLVIGPEPGGMDNPTPTHLYTIRTRYSTWVLLDDVGSIKGDKGDKGDTGATGATGPAGADGAPGPAGPAGPGVPAGGTFGQALFKGFGGDYVTVWDDIPKQVKVFDFTVSGSTVTGPEWSEVDDTTLAYDILAVAKVDFDGQFVYLPCTFYEPPSAGHTLKIQFTGTVGDGIAYIQITNGATENTWLFYQSACVSVNQGVAHAGEFLVVGSDGNVTTVTMSAWTGGSY